MKRVISVFLVIVILCMMLSSCGKTPIERADDYIKELNDSFYERCSWRSDIKRLSGLQVYAVEVEVPYYSSSDISEYSGVIHRYFKELTKEVGPKLDSMLAGAEEIDDVWIFFQYGNGNASNWYYQDGEIKDINDL